MQRKHRSQMSQIEITFVETLVYNVTEWDLATEHAEERMREKKVMKQDVLNTLKYGAVIEVKDNGRVLMRERARNGKMKSTCVVASLVNKAVVTVWRNDGSDNHSTLVESEYTWKADVVEYMGALCKR